jgi:hypothetical protein
VNSSAFIGEVVPQLDSDVVSPVGLDGRTWELSVYHQAGDVNAVRSASLLSDGPVVITCHTSDRVIGIVVCVRVSQTPWLATRQRLCRS